MSTTIRIPLSCALIVSHRSKLFSQAFSSQYFLISVLISSLIYRLFISYFASNYTGIFQRFFCYWSLIKFHSYQRAYLMTWILFFKKRLICFWLCWVFDAARGLSLAVASGGWSLLRCGASFCSGVSCHSAWAPGARGSVVSGFGDWRAGCRARAQ